MLVAAYAAVDFSCELLVQVRILMECSKTNFKVACSKIPHFGFICFLQVVKMVVSDLFILNQHACITRAHEGRKDKYNFGILETEQKLLCVVHSNFEIVVYTSMLFGTVINQECHRHF